MVESHDAAAAAAILAPVSAAKTSSTMQQNGVECVNHMGAILAEEDGQTDVDVFKGEVVRPGRIQMARSATPGARRPNQFLSFLLVGTAMSRLIPAVDGRGGFLA